MALACPMNFDKDKLRSEVRLTYAPRELSTYASKRRT